MVFRMTNLPLEETPSLLPISAFSPPTPLSRCKNINACFDLTIVPWAWWTKTCSICTTVQKAGTSTNQSCRQLAWWTSATTRTPRLGRPRWSSWSPTMRRSKSSWLDIQLKETLIVGERRRMRGLRSFLQIQGHLNFCQPGCIPCYVVYTKMSLLPSMNLHVLSTKQKKDRVNYWKIKISIRLGSPPHRFYLEKVSDLWTFLVDLGLEKIYLGHEKWICSK